jgi:hypothetical protein
MGYCNLRMAVLCANNLSSLETLLSSSNFLFNILHV